MTNDTRTVGRNTAIQILGRALSAVLGLGITAALARILSIPDFGSLTTALAVMGVLAVLHDFGTTPVAVRTIARDPEETDGLLGALADLRVRAAGPLAGVGLLALVVVGERGEFLWWALGCFAVGLAGRGMEVVDVALQVAQRLGRSVAASLAGRAGHLVFVLVLAATGERRPGPLLAAAAGGVVLSTFLRLRLARPWVRLHLRRDLERLIPFLRAAAPAGGAAILMATYLHIDAPIVRGLAGAREAALYNAPYRLFLLGASLPGLVMVSASPILAARFVADPAAFRRGAMKLVAATLAVGLPLAAGVVLAAPTLLGLLFGPGYESAAPTLRWLALAAALTGPGTVATAALIASDRAGATARLAVVALAGNVILDFALVPFLGGAGAAIATLATESLVALIGTALLLGGGPRAR